MLLTITKILFYFLMFILRCLKLVGQREYSLALILTVITLLMNYLPLFPSESFFSHGYSNT